MKGFAAVSKGIEDVACREAKEILDSGCEAKDSCIAFNFKEIKDLCKYTYLAQSVDRTALLLESSEFTDIQNISRKISRIELPDWTKNKTVVVKCRREGKHNFSSVDVEKQLLSQISKKTDFKNPDVVYYIHIKDNNFYFGIDFANFELQKRKYKIYSQPNSLRGTIAYALLRLSDFKRNEILLDPFIGDGMIVIEAALYASGISPNYYNKNNFIFSKYVGNTEFLEDIDDKKSDKQIKILGFDSVFNYVDYTRKNAKIAGVNNLIKLSRTELEWLDVKLEGKSIDKIVTKLPSGIKNNSKIVREFFYQSKFVLKDNGSIALITHHPDIVKNLALDFDLTEERSVWSGKQELKILIFKKH